MNEETNESLNEALKLFVNSLKEGKEFVLEQAPDVMQQLITFKRAEHTIIVVMSVCFVVVVGALAVSYRRQWLSNMGDHKSDDDVWGSLACAGFVWFVVCVLPIALFVESFIPMIMVWTVPKVYILQYVTELIK